MLVVGREADTATATNHEVFVAFHALSIHVNQCGLCIVRISTILAIPNAATVIASDAGGLWHDGILVGKGSNVVAGGECCAIAKINNVEAGIVGGSKLGLGENCHAQFFA